MFNSRPVLNHIKKTAYRLDESKYSLAPVQLFLQSRAKIVSNNSLKKQCGSIFSYNELCTHVNQ